MKAEQNIELVFRSAVTALQEKYNEYKKAEIKSIQATFYDSNGTFTVIDGAKEREERKAKILKELYGLIVDVERLRYEVIERQPTIEPQQKWIPCSERLPEEAYDEYLVSWTADELGEKCCIEVLAYEDEFEFDHKKDRFVGKWLLEEHMKVYTNVRVIAWKPLPEPYKEGEE